jgi:outer membrane immunogenic protein
MCRHLTATLATLGLLFGCSAAASAAEISPESAPPIYYVRAPSAQPVWSWTGFYVGANAGAAFSDVRVTDVGNFAHGGSGQAFTVTDANFLGGAQAGYNYQIGIGVFGIEGDIGGMVFNGSAMDPGGASTTMVGINSGLYGDITGRAGVAIGPTLIYAKGGWAFFDGRDSFSTTATTNSITNTSMFDGWTAGGGVEYAMTPNWTVKAEYLHFDFGSQTFNVLAPGGTFAFNEKLTAETVKFGLNYRFGWPSY